MAKIEAKGLLYRSSDRFFEELWMILKVTSLPSKLSVDQTKIFKEKLKLASFFRVVPWQETTINIPRYRPLEFRASHYALLIAEFFFHRAFMLLICFLSFKSLSS